MKTATTIITLISIGLIAIYPWVRSSMGTELVVVLMLVWSFSSGLHLGYRLRHKE